LPLLDYDNINVTFTQTNNTQNSGVVGRSGFVNFWDGSRFPGGYAPVRAVAIVSAWIDL